MTAIAPPPVGTEAEPSVQLDNARALSSLRGKARDSASIPGGSLAMVLGIGAATLLAGALGGALLSQRRRRYRQLSRARLAGIATQWGGQLAAILAKNKGLIAGALARR